jgi:hypothetical protein
MNGGATQTYTAPIYLALNNSVEFWATSAGLLDSSHTTVDNTQNKVYGGGRGDSYGGGHLPP